MQNPTITLQEALGAARETQTLEMGFNAMQTVPDVFRRHFESAEPVIVADQNTYAAAGERLGSLLTSAGLKPAPPYIFASQGLYAEEGFVNALETFLQQREVVPLAVGSGTINDITKLAAHRTGRRYISIATAASMDGYSAFGASITCGGSKQTCSCPAPLAVVADMEIVSKAPEPMNSWGYADLLAKIPAGADWILADALGVESIDPMAWGIAQSRLFELLANPRGVLRRNTAAVGRLTEGLMLSGFAMQVTGSSRPASGAEHQFSHLWDMQHHTHQGAAPSHGFKVGIGTLAVAALYEEMLRESLEMLDVDACCSRWPTVETWMLRANEWLGPGELSATAEKELRAKQVSREQLHDQLSALRRLWLDLKQRLARQLVPVTELRRCLHEAGAPVEPEQIGISRARLRHSFRQAFCIRRRFTVLDLAMRTGLLESCLERIFGANGLWPISSATTTTAQS